MTSYEAVFLALCEEHASINPNRPGFRKESTALRAEVMAQIDKVLDYYLSEKA